MYSLTGFSVSPTSVIGLLTILGYSLYDTVVVFDKVRENTAGLLTTQRSTYSEAANLALNQTVIRSINTSLTALLPVASILFIGAGLLGAGTLKDLALVLFVGMLSGAYSSLCIATPLLADLKEREPQYKDLAVKVNRRLAGGRAAAQRSAPEASAPRRPALRRPSPRRRPRRRCGAPWWPSRAITAIPGVDDDEPGGIDAAGSGSDGISVSASASRPSDASPRQVSRQQRVTGSTQRRTGSKRKRR